MTINLSTTVLSGVSMTAPGIDGDGLFGIAAVWADAANKGTLTMAVSGVSPPYSDPTVLNPAWNSPDTPAVALALDWDTIFVAFVDRRGFIQLASSADGWQGTQTIAQNVGAGPALSYSDNLLYIAWQTSSSQLGFATCDKNGDIKTTNINVSVTSRPSICLDDAARIYVLCGGTVQSSGGQIKIYLSVDNGKSFTTVATPSISSLGPPSLAILDQFYLAWADGSSAQLCLAQTPDLGTFTPMTYSQGIHNGGPALLPMLTIPSPDDINNPSTWVFTLAGGWSIGSGDSTNHHIDIGAFGPLAIGAAQIDKQRKKIAKLTAPRAPNPCPDPLTVYDPATGKCVPKGGCWGICVLSSITWGLFNPVLYAICVANCKD